MMRGKNGPADAVRKVMSSGSSQTHFQESKKVVQHSKEAPDVGTLLMTQGIQKTQHEGQESQCKQSTEWWIPL
jgi:hypothetical protein